VLPSFPGQGMGSSPSSLLGLSWGSAFRLLFTALATAFIFTAAPSTYWQSARSIVLVVRGSARDFVRRAAASVFNFRGSS